MSLCAFLYSCLHLFYELSSLNSEFLTNIQILMSGGVGLFSRQGRVGNKRFLQPPKITNSFDLFSSEQREDGSSFMENEAIQELSNVEEKSNFDSEREQPDQNDIANYLAKVQLLEEKQITIPIQQQLRPNRSLRLEDQEIIVLEQGAEVSSEVGANQSIILEHIEFANDTNTEKAPDWQEPRSRDENLHRQDLEAKRREKEQRKSENNEQVNYVINLVPESPHWANDYISNSTPYDIQSSGFKLNPNRNSKNTCTDRTQPLLPPQIKRSNKSCIQQQINFEEEVGQTPQIAKHSSIKGRNIQHILEKWNKELYPRLKNQYLETPELTLTRPRRRNSDFQMELDAKFCQSGYQQPQNSSLNSKRMFLIQEEIQTDLSGEEILHNEMYLTEEVKQLQGKNIKLQEQVRRLREESRVLRNHKQAELQRSNRQTFEQTQQARRLSSRNRQLERLLSQQNDTIRQFKQRQQSLQKNLYKTASYQTLYSTTQDRSPSFFAGDLQSLKLNKMHTFGIDQHAKNIHQKCKKEVEQLQENIFDLQQRIAGIDIEVQRRVRIISQAVQQELQQKIASQTQVLKEQLARNRQKAKIIQERLRETQEISSTKEMELVEREHQVNRMYDELVREWKEAEKQLEADRKRNRPPIKIKSNLYSPKVTTKTRFQFQRQHEAEKDDAPNPYYLPNRELKSSTISRDRSNGARRTLDVYNNNSVSYLPQEDTFLSVPFRKPAANLDSDRYVSLFSRGEENRWQRKDVIKIDFHSPKMDYRENGELSAINNKIQRLRNEINKELCAFHP